MHFIVHGVASSFEACSAGSVAVVEARCSGFSVQFLSPR